VVRICFTFCLRSRPHVYRRRIIFGLIAICEKFVKVYLLPEKSLF
jgi:hypothetical protein